MRKLIQAIILSAALTGMSVNALQAQERKLSVSTIGSDAAAKQAFEKMAAGHALPRWVKTNSTESPTHEVSFAGQTVLVMNACKPHDCSSEKIAILYDAKNKVMYGVFATSSEKTDTEKLTWMNIGGGPESVDGKTILYAALTGSLENHPAAFNYR